MLQSDAESLIPLVDSKSGAGMIYSYYFTDIPYYG